MGKPAGGIAVAAGLGGATETGAGLGGSDGFTNAGAVGGIGRGTGAGAGLDGSVVGAGFINVGAA